MTQNPVSQKCAKHIDLDYLYVQELVTCRKLYTQYVPTNHEAHIFTKIIMCASFEAFRTMLCH